MASKAIYGAVAAAGIAVASGAAWWYQRQPASVTGAEAAAPAARGASSGAARAPAVEAARVEVTTLVDEAQAVGSLRSRQSVVLRPEVSGRITKLNFRDGERVRRGQLLVQLDDQLPLAQVQQAQAELSIAEANHKRNQELVAQKFVSQRSLDESAANLKVAQAKLALAQATAARLRIVAPFDGIAGIRNISLGDYLKDGADIVNIEDLDAMYVDFRLPERYQTKLRRGQSALVDLDALPGRHFTAVVQAIDPLVDANGRSIGVRGCIDNRQLQLRPGMFARVTAVFGEREQARVIPEEAVVPQSGRQYVIKLVDGPDQDTRIAQRVEVKTGIRRPGRVEIVQGLQPGDMVVTAGQQRVQRDGMPVRVLDLGRAGQAGAGGETPAANAVAMGSGPAQPAPAPEAAGASRAAAALPQTLTAARVSGPNPCATVAAAGSGARRGGTVR
ncbi:efflux RND transporter periplasmic adaptor subunit [Ramlibacter sp.]|uniref:efflux RND transporter periplasmic adaptor subunit n=1 Tax=Ramlibacter sp. TaxID=1917967 RepID=UPI002C11D044|nr:efflux RND transporter periplasmic adaptor subunit [Ramlibacter sp.]HWI80534.1 efflux RND transporter periplasmic adaptor subunit [Ramlibacter sp.]